MPTRFVRSQVFAIALLSLAALTSRTDVKVPAVLSDHMVLQQQMPVPIWGWADAGEQVTVSFGTQTRTTKADDSGKWQVRLAPLSPDEIPRNLMIKGNNTVTISDVLVGEVWVCSGQSNMEFAAKQANNFKQEIEHADHPTIRLFTVPKWVQQQPQSDIKEDSRGHTTWQVCSPQSVPNFTAVGYFFGRQLEKSLHVPIGLIHTSWGGTPAESWAKHSYLEKDEDFKGIVDLAANARPDYEKQLAKWEIDSEKAKAENRPAPRKPMPPEQNPNLASVLYNGMIQPIVPIAIRGATWYQGESNAGRAYQYRKLLPAMVQSWRDEWNEPNMSFLIVSLANYRNTPLPKPGESEKPGESDWAELREAQTMTAALPHNGQALAIDLADTNNPADIHPKNKQEVGHRLALTALAKTYGQNITYTGPEFDTAKFDGANVTLSFKHADGLFADGDMLKGFQIAAQPDAGKAAHWEWAEAKIDGKSVIVSSPDISKPAAVRYDWAANPQGNLYNKAGLPAVPFRTDKWAGVTDKNR